MPPTHQVLRYIFFSEGKNEKSEAIESLADANGLSKAQAGRVEVSAAMPISALLLLI